MKLSYEESPKVLESWDTVSGAGHTTKMQFFYLEEDPVKDEQVCNLSPDVKKVHVFNCDFFLI